MSVAEIDEEVLDNSVGLELQDISVEEFVNDYKRDFGRAIRQLFSLRRNKDVTIISVQPGRGDSSDADGVDDRLRRRRDIDDEDNNQTLEVLFAVAKPSKHGGAGGAGYHSADHVRNVLSDQQLAVFDQIVHLDGTRLVPRTCQPNTCVFGECQAHLRLLDASEEPYVSVSGANGQSFVYPRHRHGYKCICQSGYAGKKVKLNHQRFPTPRDTL